MRIYNLWTHLNIIEHCHVAVFNISWQFDDYWKGVRIVILNFAIEIGK